MISLSPSLQHDCVLARKLELTRDSNRLVAPVPEKSDAPLLSHSFGLRLSIGQSRQPCVHTDPKLANEEGITSSWPYARSARTSFLPQSAEAGMDAA
jgi:hypothetical protein